MLRRDRAVGSKRCGFWARIDGADAPARGRRRAARRHPAGDSGRAGVGVRRAGGDSMKCPKCLYIGFETGDRCKNCGYDFSLLAAADEPSTAPAICRCAASQPTSLAFDVSSAMDDAWTAPSVDRFRDLPDEEEPALALSLAGPGLEIDPSPAACRPDGPRPTCLRPPNPRCRFSSPTRRDDEPLVKLPAVPRVPLSVRKTPEVPRLRHASGVRPAPSAPRTRCCSSSRNQRRARRCRRRRAAAAQEAAPGLEPTIRMPRDPGVIADAFAPAGRLRKPRPRPARSGAAWWRR